jgi:hypothetical protein
LEVVIDSKKAVAISRSHALNNPLNLKDGKDFVCFSDEHNVVIYSVVMLFRKYLYLVPIINEKIRVISEAGLLTKWERDSLKRASKVVTTSSNSPHGSAQIKLSIEHVQGAFMIVGIGLGLALVVFIIELFTFDAINSFGRTKLLQKIESFLCYA